MPQKNQLQLDLAPMHDWSAIGDRQLQLVKRSQGDRNREFQQSGWQIPYYFSDLQLFNYTVCHFLEDILAFSWNNDLASP